MSSPTRQRFLAVDGDDTPVLLVPENQHQGSHAQSKSNRQKHALSDNCDDGLLPPFPTGSPTTSRTNLSKLKANRGTERAKRAKGRKTKSKQMRKAGTRGKSESVTFAPADDERKRLIKVLKRKSGNKARMKLEKDLTREFLRTYIRRRHEVHANYVLVTKERAYATEAARLCIMKAVTPTRLIGYWVEHIGNFTGMRFPPLNFLARPGNVDEVSVQEVAGTKQKRKRKGKDDPEVHAYSGALNPGLRRGLVDAGIIDGTEFSDRFLMTVQTTAQSLAQGRNLFVSSKLKPMVDWAVSNLYADAD